MPEIIVKLNDNIVQKFFFVREKMRIGRAQDNDIAIDNLAISRYHATITFVEGEYWITDLDSSNGTYLNGIRVTQAKITDRDIIGIGKHQFFFYNQNGDAALPTTVAIEGDQTILLKPPAPARVLLTVSRGRQQGQQFNVTNPRTTLGRSAQSMIRISDWFVSREHAIIELRNQQYFLRDLGSWRKTQVNGTVIDEAPLKNGDVIQLGPNVQIVFSLIKEAEEPDDQPPTMVQGAAQPMSNFRQGISMLPIPPWETMGRPDADGIAEQVAGQVEEPLDAGISLDEEIPLTPLAPPPSFDSVLQKNPELAEACAALTAPDLSESDPATATSYQAEDVEPIDREPIDDLEPIILEPTGLAAPAPEDEPSEVELWSSVEVAEPAPMAEDPLEPETPTPDEPGEEAGEEAVDTAPQAVTIPDPQCAEPAQEVAPEAAPEAVPEAVVEAAPEAEAEVISEAEQAEIQLWERALQNPNPLIRKQAARRLKHLTGKEYAY